MMDFLLSIYNNKLLFYGIIVVAGFIVFSVFLVKRIDKEKVEDESVDYEKIDGDNSLFDEAINHDSDISTSDGKLDLEVMIEKMQKDLDAKASEVIEKFETEQEEKSVISYQELIGEKTSKLENAELITNEKNEIADNIMEVEDTEENNNYVIDDNTNIIESEVNNNILTSKIDHNIIETDDNILEDYNEDYSDYKENYNKERLQNILNIDETDNYDIHEKAITEEASELYQKDNFVNAIRTGEYENEPKGKFKSTDFVSPIYGVQDINIKYPTVQNMKEFKQPARNYNKFELEQTLNMKPLSDEIKQNEAFLEALKEFRKNLE